MVSLFWSWIFILQLSLVRPGLAHARVSPDHEVLAQRALETVYIRSLSKAEKTRNTFIALAIAGAVVLVVGILGLYLLYRRQKQKIPEPEAGAVEKPSWRMVDAKNDRMDWWRLSLRLQPTTPSDPNLPEGSRIERLKAALNKKAGKAQPLLPTHTKPSPTETIRLPMQSIPDVKPKYPDILEKDYRAPMYPVDQSPPQIPTLTRTLYDGGKQIPLNPRSPPRALITQGMARSGSGRSGRSGTPRSPANRRRSWLTRHQVRHPFLPLKDTDAQAPPISAPKPVAIDPSNPKLNYAVSMSKPRAAPVPPQGPRGSPVAAIPPKGALKRHPTPLHLDDSVSERKVRFGLPGSPRPSRMASPAMASPAI
ncbi:unnamed protein product [Cyclocybe aegerita]|uniref:Uncharacterized protein n=1 Tax=Cyclocybe aegerita TaxID=1973307 RepID=A0A8S0VTF7_CYCAE|nr:unnamed protein product [Cyclocybe aegerita]